MRFLPGCARIVKIRDAHSTGGFGFQKLQDGGVHEAGVFPLREMSGIRRLEERTTGNGRLQSLSYRRGKDLVVGSPYNKRGVQNFR